MSQIVRGAFVVHAKLSELGSAEVLSDEKGTLRLRFACGERSFLTEFTSQHLSVVVAGPTPRTPTKRVRASRAKPRASKS